MRLYEVQQSSLKKAADLFMYGNCLSFAVALQKRIGGDIYILLNKGRPMHAYVKAPNGNNYDYAGKRSTSRMALDCTGSLEGWSVEGPKTPEEIRGLKAPRQSIINKANDWISKNPKLFENKSYNSWTFPSKDTLQADFSEYKKKEDSKWRSRAKEIGSRFPIFNDIQHFEQCLRNAKVVDLSDSLDSQVMNRSHTQSLKDLKSLVGSYVRPRDVDRIVKGFKEGAAIPYPIILKGSKGMWIMAGNTRLDTAGIMGVPKKALLVDVSKLSEDAYKAQPMGSPHSFRYHPNNMIDAAKKIADFIRKNCKPWLAATDNGQLYVYRGFERVQPNLPAFTKRVRSDRRPLHSSKVLHQLLAGLIDVAGKSANRDNSVAVSGSPGATAMFGYRYITLPIGEFNYTWHIDFRDWSEDFWQTYANSDDPQQADIGTFNMILPDNFTKEWFDENFQFMLEGVRGDDGTLREAITNGYELMIEAHSIIAVDVDLYKGYVLPLLQNPNAFDNKLEESHKHMWSYFGGAAVCKCGKQIDPDGNISDATASMMKAFGKSTKKLSEDIVTHELETFTNDVKAHYGLEDLWISKIDDNTIYLMSIVVPKEKRGKGLSSQAMQDIVRFADSKGLRVMLTPATSDPNSSFNQLAKFYERFGFRQSKENRSRMVRDPQ